MQRPLIHFSFVSILVCMTCLSWGQSAESQAAQFGNVEFVLGNADDLDAILEVEGIYLDHASVPGQYHFVATPQAFRTAVDGVFDYKLKERKTGVVKMKSEEDLQELRRNADNCLPPIDYYPTYEAYEQMMADFEFNHPGMCQLIKAGTLNSGREILVVRIGVSGSSDSEIKPNVLLSSSMHGDELAGYILMLQLIDHLLCNYGKDDRITDLVDNINIYINPLANPNGAYRGGNNTVANASRFNTNFVDLNRNFPDPKGGPNPDNRMTQEETLIFMALADDIEFDLLCNFHGGIELINYPWDTYFERHADNDWFERISRDYADTVQHYSPAGYFEDRNFGITNGYDWYEVEGGRQDYHIYFKRGRETTVELSTRKTPDAALLPQYWEYNKNALLNYIEESKYGLQGIITDCHTGEPIKAELVIEGHDNRNSSVFSRESNGQYIRYLDQGVYDIQFLSEGYDTASYTIDIIDKSTNILNVELCPSDLTGLYENSAQTIKYIIKENNILITRVEAEFDVDYEILDMRGRIVQKGHLVDRSIKISDHLVSGLYVLKLGYEMQFRHLQFVYLR